MQFRDFLGKVQSRAHLSSLEEAFRASRATLQTLGERLGPREPEHLSAQLPEEIGNFLKLSVGEQAERFSSDEFLQRISEREDVPLPQAVFHARAVLEVLDEAVSPGQIHHVREQLPEDYQRLFETGSEGKLPSG